jgi:hypothetical protein
MNSKISIVTINYNSADETIDFLKAIKDQSETSYDIILVDNASDKTDLDRLNLWLDKNYIQGLHIIKNGINSGFSGGCNLGIRNALENGSDWVILLNNDTIPTNRFCADLRAILRDKKGIIGIPMDEGLKTAYCGKISWLKPALSHVHNMPKQCKGYYAIGGGMAIHKTVFSIIGLFDEKYFLYFEDADFSLRSSQAKMPFTIAGDIKVRHGVQASTKKIGSPNLLRYHYRNALYFNNKLGPYYIKILVWPWSILVAIKQLAKICIRRDLDHSWAILHGVMDFYMNRMGNIVN